MFGLAEFELNIPVQAVFMWLFALVTVAGLARLKRFLSSDVANLITSEGKGGLLDSHHRQVACMFCDVRRFTAFSEAVEPEEVMEVLQSIHHTMGELVERHGGTIGYRAGDGLMVVFNDPLPVERPVERAVALAREIGAAFAGVREKWRDLGHELGIGIGLAYGYATLGVIGSENRLDYTAIGNVVNVAARLCDIAEDGDILLERRAQHELDGSCETEAAGTVELKGVSRQTEVFRLVVDGVTT